MKKLLSMALVASVGITCLTGCGGTVVEEFDESKTQIFVNVFNGGLGDEWMQDLIKQFNDNNTEYQAVIRPRKFTAAEVVDDVSDGETYADVYFATGVNYQEGIYRDYFEDLSDVFNMEPDAGKGTVKQNMIDYESWHKMASKYGNGDYIFPNAETIYGMNFDYELFVENEWLAYADSTDASALTAQGITFNTENGVLKFVSATGKVNYKAGDIILKAGKDGKFGTYDDGQPTTIEEFDAMLESIVNGNKQMYSFIYTGQYSNYFNDMLSAIYGQYIGMDQFKTLFTFDSEGEQILMHDGTSKAITLNNGYDIYESEAVYQSLAFFKKYMTSATVDKDSEGQSFNHTSAQNNFLYGYTKDKPAAILCEGNWWENEAKATFNNLAREDVERGWGKREYRMFVYPYIEGQATDADKTVIGGGDLQGVVVVKQKDKAKLQKIKEFLLLSAKQANLKKFTQFTGCTKLFNYDMTEEELSPLTPYARNCWEMRQDKEHIEIAYSRIYEAANPFIFTSKGDYPLDGYMALYRENKGTYTIYPDRFLRDLDKAENAPKGDIEVLEVLYGARSNLLGYSEEQWTTFLNNAKQEGFFTNV